MGNAHFAAVAWAADGTRLYAGGGGTTDGLNQLIIWNQAGARLGQQVGGSHDDVQDIAACGDGVAVAARDPAFGLLTRDGSPLFWRNAVQAVLNDRRGENKLAVSFDAQRIRFWMRQSAKPPILFDLGRQYLGEEIELSKDIDLPDTKSLPIDWANAGSPKLDGKLLKLTDDDRALSIAIAPDKERFVLGAGFQLRGFDKYGNELWYKQVPGAAWALNIAGNGVVVAAYGDGTIRWHRLNDGQELLALFVLDNDRRWVAWTPKGYFTASAGGEELIGWHVNRAWNETADFFPASKFRDQFYRPDIVARILVDLDEEKAIAEANLIAKKAREDEDIRKRQPPVIRILSPSDGFVSTSEKTKIVYSLRSPSGLPIRRVFAQVDGKLVEGSATAVPKEGTTSDVQGVLTLKLPRRAVVVSVTAETDQAFETQNIRLVGASPTVPVSPPPPLPNLYAVVIGVANYINLPALPFANDDALAVAELLAAQKGGTYADVTVKLFTTRVNPQRVYDEAEASHANIIKGLNWLRKSRTDSDGIILIYFSGHGQTEVNGTSHLFPANFNPEDFFGTALNKGHLLEGLTRQGRALLFIDACHAAGGLASIQERPLNANGFVNDVAASGSWAFAFASSLPNQPSFGTGESKSFFTKALVEGLGGKAAPVGEKVILTVDLDGWLTRQVKKLSDGEQVAVMFKSPTAEHVPLAILP